jgi:tribbles-like protein
MEDMKALVIPKGTEILEQHGKIYLFSPNNFGSLHSFVQGQKRLDEDTTRKLYRQIVRLVAFCHAIGIVVRDLKLRKFVFLDKEQTTLGLSSVKDLVVLDDPTDDQLSDRHGCPAYVSPEILDLQQKTYSGKAADVWSLGVLLFVMLLGRYPFYDSTPAGLFGKIREGTFSIPAELSLSLEVRFLIRGLLRRAPKERPSAEYLMEVPWFDREASPTPQAPGSLTELAAAAATGARGTATGYTGNLSHYQERIIQRMSARKSMSCDDQVVPTFTPSAKKKSSKRKY